MTTTQQPESIALQLADIYEKEGQFVLAEELRRLHACVVELEADLGSAHSAINGLKKRKDDWKWRAIEAESQLEAIGAGGVESLRKKDTAKTRTVDSGALQMVINALRRDASEGKAIRGEMADELEKVIQ